MHTLSLHDALPIYILGKNKVNAVKTVKTILGEKDHNGRKIPITIPNSEKIYKADAVIVAFGFRASPATWFKDFNIQVKKNGLVIAEEKQNFKFQTPYQSQFQVLYLQFHKITLLDLFFLSLKHHHDLF